jgi:hypothetical protein
MCIKYYVGLGRSYFNFILFIHFFHGNTGSLIRGFVHGIQVLYTRVSVLALAECYFMLISLVKIPVPGLL